MASIFVSAVVTMALVGPALRDDSPSRGGALVTTTIEGEVELTPVAAMRSAEAAVRSALWERYAEDWLTERAFYVPAERVADALRSFLSSEVARRRGPIAQPVEELVSSSGTGFRQRYVVAFEGRDLQRLRDRGAHVARRLNDHFAIRYAALAALWALLGLIGFGLDRATRGWLTGRIAFSALVAGSVSTYLLWP